MKIFGKIIPILILSLLSPSVLLIQGCGDKAPFGTTITVEEIGVTTFNPSNPTQDPSNATKTQYYRVTVLDADGLPMNGIKVDVLGTISSNGVIDSFGDATPPGTSFNEQTGNFGFFDFPIVAHVYRPVTLDFPSTVSVTGSTTGGTLTIPMSSSVTFCYEVSVIDATTPVAQETRPSPPGSCATIVNSSTTAAITTASVTVSWSAVFGANGYRVYGRTANPPGPMGFIGSTTFAILTLPDSGSVTPGAAPAGTGPVTTNLGSNAITGTITATSGASIGTFGISF